jgi:hypothetical protein
MTIGRSLPTALLPVAWCAIALAVSVLISVRPLLWTPSLHDPSFYALMAGLHSLYVLGSISRALPWNARIEIAALRGPLTRFLQVQAVSQGIALAAWAVLDGTGPRYQALPLVAALLVAAIGGLLVRRARHP